MTSTTSYPSTKRTHTLHRASSQASPVFSISEKTLGQDKLWFGAIRLLWKWDERWIMGLTQAAIRIGRHPAVWNWASREVFRKLGKDDYTKLKAYRSISLLSWVGEVVEEVVAELLSDYGERRGLLIDGPFWSRNWRSAIKAAATKVVRAHAASTHGHITGMLLMDIKAAFPRVAKGRLINLMKVRQMDGDLIRWTESCLLERMVERIVKCNAMETPSGSSGPTALTRVTNSLCDLHLRTDQMGWRVSLSQRAVFWWWSQLCGDWKPCQAVSHDTREMRSEEHRVGK